MVSIAVALGKPQRALLAGGSPGESAYLENHEPLSGKADHLAQHIGVRRLFQNAVQVHYVIGYLCGSPVLGLRSQPDPTGNPDDH